MSNQVDPKHFRKRFMSAIEDVFDAAEKAERANAKMSEALTTLHVIAGQSFAAAVHELATEPRRVCNGPSHAEPVDFIASETGRDICSDCVRAERTKRIVQS